MLNNKKTFARLMALLRRIDPKIPIPDALEFFLWMHMEHVPFKKKILRLVIQGDVPGKAFYLVAGFIWVYYFNEKGERRMIRIYDRDSIVALDSFMSQTESPYHIDASAEAVLLSIDYRHMPTIYRTMPAVQELARKTAARYEQKELMRDDLVHMEYGDRVLKFYNLYEGLLPPRKSVIRDADIASFLLMGVAMLRRIRSRLKNEELLNY